MSYEEEDTCHMRRRTHVTDFILSLYTVSILGHSLLRMPGPKIEEDTGHMRRRIRVIGGGGHMTLTFENVWSED